jgi:hypothetical protein
MAQWGSGGSVGGCCGSVGDVGAQWEMWWHSWLSPLGEPDCNAAVPGSIPASHSILRDDRSYCCVNHRM